MDLDFEKPNSEDERKRLLDIKTEKLCNMDNNLFYLRFRHNNLLTHLPSEHLKYLCTVLSEIIDTIIKCDCEGINIDLSFLDKACHHYPIANINLTELNQMLEEYQKLFKNKSLTNETILVKRTELSNRLPDFLKPFINQLFPYDCYYKVVFFSDEGRFYLNYRIELFDFEGAFRTTDLKWINIEEELDAIPFAYPHIGSICPEVLIDEDAIPFVYPRIGRAYPKVIIDENRKIKLLIINDCKARIYPLSSYSDMNKHGNITTIEYSDTKSFYDNEGIEMFYLNKKLSWAFSPKLVISKDIRNTAFYHNFLKNLASQINFDLLQQCTEILEEIKKQILLATDENIRKRTKN